MVVKLDDQRTVDERLDSMWQELKDLVYHSHRHGDHLLMLRRWCERTQSRNRFFAWCFGILMLIGAGGLLGWAIAVASLT